MFNNSKKKETFIIFFPNSLFLRFFGFLFMKWGHIDKEVILFSACRARWFPDMFRKFKGSWARPRSPFSSLYNEGQIECSTKGVSPWSGFALNLCGQVGTWQQASGLIEDQVPVLSRSNKQSLNAARWKSESCIMDFFPHLGPSVACHH